MRTSVASFLVLALLSLAGIAYAQTASTIFSRDLHVGSSGPDVQTLQVLLNSDPATQIAASGPGSPGNETTYFGPLTEAAVKRFQEKYASSVLAPLGLNAPTGYVGASSRARLGGMLGNGSNGNVHPVAPGTPVVPVGSGNTSTSTDFTGQGFVNTVHPVAPGTPLVPITGTTTASSTTIGSGSANSIHPIAPSLPVNPNLEPSQIFLNDIETAATKQGLPPDAIQAIKTQVMSRAATSTDLNASFLGGLPKRTSFPVVSLSPWAKVVAWVRQALQDTFLPQHAYAEVSATPFGGSLIFNEEICNEDSQYLVEITPHPPSYAVFLMYTPGTQKYSAYNIPNTKEVLGSYSGNTACVIGTCPYCYTFTTYGTIQPQVGSTQEQ